MRTPAPRPFRLSDAVILIAATAFGLAGCRFWLVGFTGGGDDPWRAPVGLWTSRLWVVTEIVAPLASIQLHCWTAAVLWIRLRHPRPRRRLLWGQPGFLACFTAAFSFMLAHAGYALSLGVNLLTHHIYWSTVIKPGEFVAAILNLLVYSRIPSSVVTAGATVSVVWLVVWAGGRCRAERGWVDRLGRVLGAAWICTGLLLVFSGNV